MCPNGQHLAQSKPYIPKRGGSEFAIPCWPSPLSISLNYFYLFVKSVRRGSNPYLTGSTGRRTTIMLRTLVCFVFVPADFSNFYQIYQLLVNLYCFEITTFSVLIIPSSKMETSIQPPFIFFLFSTIGVPFPDNSKFPQTSF